MTHRSSSSPLIKGIDGIVSRYSNEVNYSVLNETKIESGKQPENEIQQKYRKYGLRKIEKYVKQEKNTGKNGHVIKPGEENEIELKNDAESDGAGGVATRKIHNGGTGEAAKVQAKSENVKNKNTIITLHLLNEMVKQCKTLEIRAAIVKALNGKRMESGKQPGNKIRRKYRKYGLRNMENNMKEGKYTGKIKILNRRGNEKRNDEKQCRK